MFDQVRLKLPEETIVKDDGDKYLFLIPSKPDWVVTNRNGAIALSLCNGERSIEQIMKLLSAIHPDPFSAITFLEKLDKVGFFQPSNEKQLKNCDQLPKLNSVHLNISSDCNLNCTYCYAEEREAIGGQLSLAEYRVIIDELASMNKTMSVAITGGEPVMNNNACDISLYCKSKGFYTYLLTNATLINESNAEQISSSFDEIRISVDGYKSATHDFYRGPGSHEKTVRAIDLLETAGANIRIAMTVTKQNIEEIELMAKFYGSRLTFQPLFNAGSARNNNSEMAITGEEYFHALNNAKGVAPMGDLGRSLERLRGRGTTSCAIANGEISISHNGDVYPCHMLHVPEFYAGNIRELNISNIYSQSTILNKIRQQSIYTKENCTICPIRLLCGGGCRARTYYLTRDLNGVDDFCEYELLAFIEGLMQSAVLNDVDKNSNTYCCKC